MSRNRPQRQFWNRRCALCDAHYLDTDPEAVREHEHPEPQSGLPRKQLMESGLPYERWIVETLEGRIWDERKRERKR